MLKYAGCVTAGVIAFGLMTTAAWAHGAWIAERWGDLAIVYGHGAGDDPYDPAKVTDVTALDAEGRPVAVELQAAETHTVIVPAANPALIAMVFDNGFWSQQADGKWVNRPRDEVPGAVTSGHYVKNNITLFHTHGDLPPLPSQALQIVPLSNPTELKAGDSFTVRVIYDGEPVPGVQVALDYINASGLKSAETDANGEAEVQLRNDGLNVLAVEHTVPLMDNAQADEIGYTATLSFVAADHIDE